MNHNLSVSIWIFSKLLFTVYLPYAKFTTFFFLFVCYFFCIWFFFLLLHPTKKKIRLHFKSNKSKTFSALLLVFNRFNLLYPKLNSMQQLNFHFHLCSTKSKTKKSLSHKMNSLVAHDQLANLNFGKLRINSKIPRYLSFAGIFLPIYRKKMDKS